MKVSWPHTDEYATLYESAEWHARPVVSRNFWKGVGWTALFSLPFWVLIGWVFLKGKV